MYINDLETREGEEEELSGGEGLLPKADGAIISWWDAKKVFVGAGARALFYPTLLYNVVRNKIQSEFRWWDWIDEFVLLGAIPFSSDIYLLKELGVRGVVTLNESYETLVPTSLYKAHGMHHLVLPTRDYLFAPSQADICRAVYFIHGNASHGESTYVHCKAGRGRSTTIVICYLMKYKQMTPDAAYAYVKSIRPRVLLASAQMKAVQEFYHKQVKGSCSSHWSDLICRRLTFFAGRDLFAFDDDSVVVITEADLGGYNPENGSAVAKHEIWSENLIYRVKVVSGAALARLSCLWLHSHGQQKIACDESTNDSGQAVGAPETGNITLDIHIFS